MVEPRVRIEATVKDLEEIQARIGQLQVSLLSLLTDGQVDTWDDPAQRTLVSLEGVQRSIGDVQVELVKALAASPEAAEETGLLHRAAKNGVPTVSPAEGSASIPSVAPSLEAPPVVAPVAWLEAGGIQVIESSRQSGIDSAAERVAVFLGDRYPLLERFYESVKRALAMDVPGRYSVEGLPGDAVNAHVQFMTLLHGCAFLSQARYFRNERLIRFSVNRDGRVQNLLSGGWLERYVLNLVKRSVGGGAWRDEQAAVGVKIRLPDGTDGELDVLASLPGSGVLWIECKTGEWQSAVERFKAIQAKLGPRLPGHRALVLLHAPEPELRGSVAALSGLRVLPLGEVPAWLQEVATARPGVEPAAGQRA